MPEEELLSVEQVAELLGLHVRTVRAWVREGRLKATRPGKQYVIARQDLEALLGRPLSKPEPVRRSRHAEVSSIVEIDALRPELAVRLTNSVTSAPRSRPHGDAPVRVEAIYNEERARLKVILTGSLETVARLLQMIATFLEQNP